MFLQDIISRYAEKLYRGYEILASAPFRITRNSNLYLEEEESRTLSGSGGLASGATAQRRSGAAGNRSGRAPGNYRSHCHHLRIGRIAGISRRGAVNLQRLFHLYEETPRPDLKYPKFVPRQVHIGHDADSMFEVIAPAGCASAPPLRFLRSRGGISAKRPRMIRACFP